MFSVIFPGQGSQSVGMAKDFYNKFKDKSVDSKLRDFFFKFKDASHNFLFIKNYIEFIKFMITFNIQKITMRTFSLLIRTCFRLFLFFLGNKI